METCAIPTSVPPTPTPTPTPTLTPTLTLCQGYRDEDGDTYGAGKGTGYQNGTLVSVTCAQGGGLPAGYASRAGDCYDKNANAKPGNNTWQTTTRGTSVLGKDSENNTWSSYDYNCDGLETKETSSVRLYRTYSPCDDDSGNQNYACEWSDETNWACGASGYTGCSDSRGECNGAHWSSPSRSGYITNRCY
ncbi:MAG: hypothetical protein HYT83_01730 [Candidatus Levybacteria bacterium]|nr:hypothetical protein [Candidatus Levybacteria bacterium]